MAAGLWTTYESVREYLADGTLDLDSNSFKVALVTSAYSPDVAANTVWADVSVDEVANGNGYTAGGYAITPEWTRSGAVATFNSDNPNWTASGGPITARYAVLYQSGLVNGVQDALVAFCLLDDTPADVSVTDGNTLTIQLSANGYFTLS